MAFNAPPRFYVAARAFTEAVFGLPDRPPPQDRVDWVVNELEATLVRGGSRARLIVRLSLFAVSVLAPLFVRRVTLMRRLPLAQRIVALDRMEKSAIAAPVMAVKALLCLFYYEHPAAAAEVGFVGQGFAEQPAPQKVLP